MRVVVDLNTNSSKEYFKASLRFKIFFLLFNNKITNTSEVSGVQVLLCLISFRIAFNLKINEFIKVGKMFEVMSVFYFLICFAILFGYLERERNEKNLRKEIYFLQIYVGLNIIYYIYLLIVVNFLGVKGSPLLMIIPIILSFSVISYYWKKFKIEREMIIDSFLFKIFSFFALLFCNVASIYTSVEIFENTTKISVGYFQNYIDIARWIYFVLYSLVITQLVFLISFFGCLAVPFISNENKREVLSFASLPIASLYIINLACLILFVDFFLKKENVADYIYMAFKYNLNNGEVFCSRVDENAKIKLIGGNKAIVAIKNKGSVYFSEEKCSI